MLELNGTLIAVIINFAILAWLMNYFLYKPVGNMLAERKKLVEDTINSAEKKLAEADAVKKEYEKQISGAQAQSSEIIQKANIASEKMKGETMNNAKKDADFIKIQAEKENVPVLQACHHFRTGIESDRNLMTPFKVFVK